MNLKIGTLDALVLLSDDLAKYDTAFEQTVNKLADILTNLVKSDSTNGHVSEYMLVNDSKYTLYSHKSCSCYVITCG